MYAGGGPHPLRDPCSQVLDLVRNGQLRAVTSVEVVQEILHRFLSVGRPDMAGGMAIATLELFDPVLPVTHEVMHRVPALVGRYPGLSARDLVHVATCINAGIDAIISPDTGFDGVAEVRRIAPGDTAALASYLR